MEIKDVVEQKTAAVRLTTSIADLPNTIGKVYHEIMAHLHRQGGQVTGPPFVLYHNMDMQALDVELDFPVDRVIDAEGRIRAGTLPGGKILSEVHTGPYSTLEKTYTAVMSHIEEQGLHVTDWMYESYLNSPENTPEAQLKTEVCFPLAS